MISDIMTMSLLAGLATSLGSLVVLIFGRPNEKALAVFLGMAAGIMLAVVVVDLLPSALVYGNLASALSGFLLGVSIMFGLDELLTNLYPKSNETHGRKGYLKKMGYLIAIGIALHDLPEGMAIAVGYTATTRLGLLLVLGIGMHNIPEGMATAAPLRMGGLNSLAIFAITSLVSLFTPLGTWLGLYIMKLNVALISVMLALAAGAMAYLVKDELLPESYRIHPNYANLGLAVGSSIIVALTFLH